MVTTTHPMKTKNSYTPLNDLRRTDYTHQTSFLAKPTKVTSNSKQEKKNSIEKLFGSLPAS